MRWALLLIPSWLFAQASTPDALTGSWINEDLETRGVTQITVRRDSSTIIVHVWGSCRPTDCDWGEAEAELWNGIPMVVWNHGFSTVRMQLVQQPDRRLLLAYRTEYHDESGRKDNGRAEFFAREGAHTEGADAAAKAVLQQVAETYRNLPNSRFEWDETSYRMAAKSEVRTVTHTIVLYAPPDRARVESTGAGENTITIIDGRSVWLTYPQSNEYTVTPKAKGASSGLVEGYSLLDKGRATPRIVGRERFQEVDCTVVELSMERGVTRKLWIDNATHLIRKETSDELPSRKRETIFTVLRTGESMPPETFAYDPATTQAKNRRQLAREAPKTLTGKPAPDFVLRDLEGREVRLSDLRGKAVLLDFWATWCGYCREALPMMELLHRSLKDKGLAVYGIDSEEPQIAREYLLKYGYTMPSLADRKEETVNGYHVQGWPTTVLIDREGKVSYYGVGQEPEKLRDAIRALGLW